MDCYLIDYENVGAKGVESLARLKDGDRAVIFYSGGEPCDRPGRHWSPGRAPRRCLRI